MANNPPTAKQGNKTAAPVKQTPPINPNKTLTTEAEAKAESKSVVPAKYAGKYKDGGQGATSEFIKAQCTDKDGTFSFSGFFDLARKNGIADDKVSLYEGQVNAKTNGASGRARMTLGNMLRAMARKNQSLVGLNGKKIEVLEPALPKPEKKAA